MSAASLNYRVVKTVLDKKENENSHQTPLYFNQVFFFIILTSLFGVEEGKLVNNVNQGLSLHLTPKTKS